MSLVIWNSLTHDQRALVQEVASHYVTSRRTEDTEIVAEEVVSSDLFRLAINQTQFRKFIVHTIAQELANRIRFELARAALPTNSEPLPVMTVEDYFGANPEPEVAEQPLPAKKHKKPSKLVMRLLAKKVFGKTVATK